MTNRIVVPQPADSGTVRGLLSALCGRYRFLELQPVGRSVLGRDIYGLLLGGGPDRVLYAAAFHGQEWITTLVLLRLCEEICRALDGDGWLADMDFRRAMAGRCLVFIPQANPDGVDIALRGSVSAGRLAPLVAEKGGDTPGLWQANARGVDLNHNFDAGWAALQELERQNGICGPAPRRFGGEAAESEPETKALTALCRRGDFRHVVALHSQGEEIYWQYGTRTPSYARMMADILAAASGYRVADPEGLASHGGFKDWFIEATGRPGFTIELGRGANPLPLSDFEPLYEKAREMLLLAALM
ncbi:MAG: M14 family metallocarboxypeptidase [Clostridia bacterium]|nr:M14 family metallocarboxypeptidase [Clostridia bacterium]